MELISYETIRAAHRQEKEEELQKLPDNFFDAIRNWFSYKQIKKDNSSILEIENAKKLVDDLINRRQRKLVLAALGTIRGQVPPRYMSEEEQKFFDQLIIILKNYKTKMGQEIKNYDVVAEEQIDEIKKTINELTIKIKILSDIPEFIGEDSQKYGPFKNQEIVTLPRQIAEILISRNAAESIKNM